MKLYISPEFSAEDKGDGGIRRIVEAQKKYLPALGIDVIDDSGKADIVAVHAGSWVKTSAPVVAHSHGLYWEGYKWGNWTNTLNYEVIRNLKRARACSAPSHWVANALRRGLWVDAKVLWHGVDIKEFTPGDNPRYVLWNKTRVDPICDFTPVNKLAEMAVGVNFVSTFGNYSPNVTITGRLSYVEAKEYVRNALVYLCTTRETFGVGTLEAMACGVPILGWNWGGQAEFVEHKVTGWLAEPGDYSSLLEGLYFCINNRKTLSTNAREVVQNEFTWEKRILPYVDLYNEALNVPSVKVSVVIPSYNLQEFLKDAVKSVQSQEFKDYEIIIVDDCSTDDSFKIANKLAVLDRRIRVIRNEKNLYLAGALNVGIEAAKGKYIVPLDADNMLGVKETLSVLSEALDNDLDLDIAYGAMELIEEDGRRWISTWPRDEVNIYEQLEHKNQCTSTSMYRRTIWERTGGYRRRCKTAEDADFWTRAVSIGAKGRKVTDAVTLCYRNRHNSMSHVNKDWDWTAGYPWAKEFSLAPFGINQDNVKVKSYDPTRVTVVIPVGPGHENIVIDAIDSVVAQDFLNWEIIVVNNSGNPICRVPSFVKIIEAEKGIGPAKARNIGIEAANKASKFFVPLDADDYLEIGALSSMLEAIDDNSYVYGDCIEQETNITITFENFSAEALLKKMPHAVTALYPIEAWKEVGGFNESLKGWEDWYFLLAICERKYCGIHIDTPTFIYRKSTGTRREETYANSEENKKEIFAVWGDYIKGEKKMPCSGCRSKKVNMNDPVQNVKATPAAFAASNAAILIEYVGDGGPITYIGAVSGQNYRFGSDPGHKIRYVYPQDAEALLLRAEFKVASA